MNEAGLEPVWVQGRRYTDERTLRIVEHTLVTTMSRYVNPDRAWLPEMSFARSACVLLPSRCSDAPDGPSTSVSSTRLPKSTTATKTLARMGQYHIASVARTIQRVLGVNADTAARKSRH
jgi:hypothetical protein